MEALHDVVKAGQGPLPRRLLDVRVAVREAAARRRAARLDAVRRRCRTSTTCSTARRSARCSACSPTRASAPSPTARSRRAAWPARGASTTALDNDPVGQAVRRDPTSPIVDAVQRVAEARGVPMAQVALAWVLRNPVVTAPIVGATKPHHLADAVAAVDVALTDDEVAALEEPYGLPQLAGRDSADESRGRTLMAINETRPYATTTSCSPATSRRWRRPTPS